MGLWPIYGNPKQSHAAPGTQFSTDSEWPGGHSRSKNGSLEPCTIVAKALAVPASASVFATAGRRDGGEGAGAAALSADAAAAKPVVQRQGEQNV